MASGKRTKRIRLIASDRMDSGGSAEDSSIRIPKRARQYFAAKGDRVVLRTKKSEQTLWIKQAYKCDTMELKKLVSKGNLSEADAKKTGFITSRTWERLYGSGTGRAHCYLTDGIEDIMLGADPEFALVDPKTLRYKYAQHVPGLSKNDELGHDGPLAEVRPPPDTSVEGVVRNLKNIFSRDQKKVDAYLWLGGAAYKCPHDLPNERIPHIGGHLQFGNPLSLTLPPDQINSIYKRTVRVLDEVVGLPMVRIDTPFPHLRRNTKWQGYGHYGRYGDFKAKENRFEWRVLSGLWLAHPELAQAVMGTSKAVVEACYQMMADAKFDPDWICSPANRKGFLKKWGAMGSTPVSKIINDADPSKVTVDLLNRSAKKLRGLENYNKYKAEIEEFIKLIKLKKTDRENLNLDLKDSWLGKGKLITGGKKA